MARTALVRFVKDNGMSIAFSGLFVVCLVAQGWSGWFSYGNDLAERGLDPIPLSRYLVTGTFLDGMFSNWQAAILQLGVLIAFGGFLHQRGAPRSKKPDGEPGKKGDPDSSDTAPILSAKWLHDHSLGLAFAFLFTLFFLLHMLFGWIAHNEQELLRHQAATDFAGYVASAGFWFSVFQTWEAEFLAIGVYMVLSIFLREKGSSESKPSDGSDQDTGEANA